MLGKPRTWPPRYGDVALLGDHASRSRPHSPKNDRLHNNQDETRPHARRFIPSANTRLGRSPVLPMPLHNSASSETPTKTERPFLGVLLPLCVHRERGRRWKGPLELRPDLTLWQFERPDERSEKPLLAAAREGPANSTTRCHFPQSSYTTMPWPTAARAAFCRGTVRRSTRHRLCLRSGNLRRHIARRLLRRFVLVGLTRCTGSRFGGFGQSQFVGRRGPFSQGQLVGRRGLISRSPRRDVLRRVGTAWQEQPRGFFDAWHDGQVDCETNAERGQQEHDAHRQKTTHQTASTNRRTQGQDNSAANRTCCSQPRPLSNIFLVWRTFSRQEPVDGCSDACRLLRWHVVSDLLQFLAAIGHGDRMPRVLQQGHVVH